MSNESRKSMVRSAISLIGAHGLNATSLSDVLADSGAPRGSIYHHFPDGKKQLAEEAVQRTAEIVLARQRACTATTPEGVLGYFIDTWRQFVLRSAGAVGCSVAGVAVDTDASDTELIGAVRAAFRSWVDLLAKQLLAAGIPAERAKSIALASLAGMEGALILCRAEGSAEPLESVAAELLRTLPQAESSSQP